MMTEQRWGVELWDCVSQVLAEVTANNSFLNNTCSKYIRERAEVERDYAKSLRKLSVKYSSNNPQHNDSLEDQRQMVKSFRICMRELGYQAGQHELLAEELQRVYPAEMKNNIKETVKMIETIKRDLKGHQLNLEKSYKTMEKYKSKYFKCQEDYDNFLESSRLYNTNSFSKEQIKKDQELEDNKIQYAVQLVQTNKCQTDYYDCHLPAAVDSVQKVFEGQLLYFASVMSRCVESETSKIPIILKCHSDMELCLKEMDIGKEINEIIEKHKTGAVPPVEIQFDDVSSKSLISGVLASSEPLQLSTQTDSGKSLYQEKREIEKKLKSQEEQIQKGIKEILALRKMIQTYTQNPKFGSADKLCEQLEMSCQRVEVLKSGVMLLRGNLERVTSNLEIIKMSNESYYYSNYGSVSGSRTPDIYSSTEAGSSDQNREYESIEKLIPFTKKNNFYGYNDEEEDNVPEENHYRSLESLEDVCKSKVYDWVTQCRRSPSPPPPPLPSEPPITLLSRVVALYSFISEVKNSINMEEGEEFFVTEQDVDGWTRVKRVNIKSEDESAEGFVPSSFIKFIS